MEGWKRLLLVVRIVVCGLGLFLVLLFKIKIRRGRF